MCVYSLIKLYFNYLLYFMLPFSINFRVFLGLVTIFSIGCFIIVIVHSPIKPVIITIVMPVRTQYFSSWELWNLTLGTPKPTTC